MNDKRFVILDRDGTINVEEHYLSDPEKVKLLPQAAAGLRRMSGAGLGLVVMTNQSGVGRGFFDLTRVEAVNARLCQLLEEEGVRLDGIYVCPHLPEDGCACRKPNTGLVEQASRDLGFTPSDCFVIGDKDCDIDLGHRMGATTLLVRTGYGNELEADPGLSPDYVVDDLAEAARVISGLLTGG